MLSVDSRLLINTYAIHLTMAFAFVVTSPAEDFTGPLQPFFEKHCYECHDDLTTKGGLDLTSIPSDLDDDATMANWVRIYDRVSKGEMPPKDEPRPEPGFQSDFQKSLEPSLIAAHQAQKGTVLRRLNRTEYQNTLNDIFGINIDVKSLLPEDGRSHEFDNVGESLSISMVQMQRYLDAARKTLDEAIASQTAPDKSTIVRASYADTRGAEKFLGKSWLKLPNGAVVFYRKLGYPTGMLREAASSKRGLYKIRVTGYAHQSDKPVVFSVGSTTFKRGVETPTYGYFSFQPGKPQTVELTAWMEERYMLVVEPQGIYEPNYLIKRIGIENYEGPGLAIQHIEVEGPIIDDFPGKGHEMIFSGLKRQEIEPSNPDTKTKSWYVPQFEIKSDSPRTDAEKSLSRIAEVAFRRTLTPEDLTPYLDLFDSELARKSSFEEALRTSIQAILCSPDFLYLKEKPGRLNDYALASRLSYFLNRTLPDEALLSAAASGDLTKNPEALRQHALRLLKSENSSRFINDFTDAWLDLRNIEFTIPDKKLFPEYDPYLKDSMLTETRGFFRELISSNLSVVNVVKSDFIILNDRLAEHYEIDGDFSPEFKKSPLPPCVPRGGLISQASILKVSANGSNTSPVLRGVFINERVLGKYPAPPPPGVSGVEPDTRGVETLREKLAKHRDSENCNSCHAMIDPPGFALESFDPVGTWRENFRSLGEGEKVEEMTKGVRVAYKKGLPVDSSGEVEPGKPFSGFEEFQNHLAKDPDTLARALASKLLIFASGREMGFSDRIEIAAIVENSSKNGYGVRDLILEVVASEIFRNK